MDEFSKNQQQQRLDMNYYKLKAKALEKLILTDLFFVTL